MNYEDLPKPLLAVGPLIVLGAVASLLYVTSPFGDAGGMADASTVEVLWMMTVIGLIAGVMPVAIGMLWFPFVKSLDSLWVHAMLALSAGILAFIGVEMSDEMVDIGADLAADGASTGRVGVAVALGVGGVVLTFLAMKAVGDWRRRTVREERRAGLRVAYLVAIGLGFHSIGEGLAVGTSFATGAYTAVTLLVVGFVLHNITEGLTVVAAIARDGDRPDLRHFVAVGLLAGGPLILGGWLGAFAFSPLLAIAFLAVGVGAILEVIWEVAELVRLDAGTVVTRVNLATFGSGIGLMFVLEEIIVEGYVIG